MWEGGKMGLLFVGKLLRYTLDLYEAKYNLTRSN